MTTGAGHLHLVCESKIEGDASAESREEAFFPMPSSSSPCRLAHSFTLTDRILNGIVDLHAKVAEHNRLIRLLSTGQGKKHKLDGHGKVDNEIIPNQVNHEYDFGIWKGYAGQFSPEFVRELEAHEEVEYLEDDTMMWAWGIEAPLVGQAQDVDVHDGHQQKLDQQQQGLDDQMILKVNRSSSLTAKGLVNGHTFEYSSLRAPSWGLTRIAQRQRDLRKDYSYMSSAG